MSLIKAKIDGAIYDVLDAKEVVDMKDLPNSKSFIAVDGHDGCLYPIRDLKDNRPGFYPTGSIDYFKRPSPSEYDIYSNGNEINFSDATNIRQIIKAQQKLASEERTILTTIDNVFAPAIGANDTPEMIAVKTAINEKHIDLDKYEGRFGLNYNNDKRLLRKDSITFGKLRTVCNALDMSAKLIIEDAAPDVPNPIGRSIVIDITGPSTSISDDEEES